MLDEYCDSLPEHAQVAMCMRLLEIGLPIWEKHVGQHPDDLAKVNALITAEHRVHSGLDKVAASLPRSALHELQAMIDAGKDINASSSLKRYLATFMEPLTNPAWDDALPLSVRLVFTATWNLLTYLLYTKKNQEGETHVYVAVNQACDAISREQLLSQADLEKVLQEYKAYKGISLVNTAQAASMRKEGSVFPSVRQMFPSMYKGEAHAACPACGSSDVQEEPVWIEFTRMHCNACGNDETCDVWQLDDWYR
jgi:hypothetical protein